MHEAISHRGLRENGSAEQGPIGAAELYDSFESGRVPVNSFLYGNVP